MSRFERWSVWLTAGATIVTGVVYTWMKYALTAEDPWSVINHPLQPWVLKTHIIAAPLFIFALGLITLKHIWNHYRGGLLWGRKSGIVTGLVTAPMILSGYLIQAVTHEGILNVIAITHIVLGFVFAVGFVLHFVHVRRRTEANTVAGTSGGRRASAKRSGGRVAIASKH